MNKFSSFGSGMKIREESESVSKAGLINMNASFASSRTKTKGLALRDAASIF